MKWKYEKEFREAHPETVGETDGEYDLDNYKDFLESLIEKSNGTKPPLCDVLAELKKVYFYSGSTTDFITIKFTDLEKVLSKYFA